MTRIKIISSIVFAAIFLATQVIAVGAAPANQETTPITGTVVGIELDTESVPGVTTVLVTLDDGTGVTQTVRLSLEDATTLGLVINGTPVDPETIIDPVEIDPALVIPDVPEETEEEAQHPVGSAISEFFSDLLGVDYETVMEYHEEGVGFGVIAQALWMTNALEGDSETFAAIMEAKQTKDYSAITLPDGSTPENWGQFRKAVMHDRDKSKENLGAIMSGHANDGQGEEAQNGTQNNGTQNNGNGNNPDKDKGNKDKDNNGKGKDKDKGNKD
jgi:hypothetical protein